MGLFVLLVLLGGLGRRPAMPSLVRAELGGGRLALLLGSFGGDVSSPSGRLAGAGVLRSLGGLAGGLLGALLPEGGGGVDLAGAVGGLIRQGGLPGWERRLGLQSFGDRRPDG